MEAGAVLDNPNLIARCAHVEHLIIKYIFLITTVQDVAEVVAVNERHIEIDAKAILTSGQAGGCPAGVGRRTPCVQAPEIIVIGGGVIPIVAVTTAVVNGDEAKIANCRTFLGVQVRTAIAHPHFVVDGGGVGAGWVLRHPIVDDEIQPIA